MLLMSGVSASLEPVAFSADEAMDFLSELSKPRIVGSKAEAEAIDLITNRLKDLGLEPVKHKFAFWPFFPWLAVKSLTLLLVGYLIAIWALAPSHPVLAGIFSPLSLAIISLVLILSLIHI